MRLPLTGARSLDRHTSQWAFARAGTGEDVVLGALTVRNRGDDPATLTAARLTGPDGAVADAGARVLEVMVRDVSDGQELVGAARWPFEDFARGAVPLDEHRLGPGRRVELLVVVRVEDSGHWFWPDTEISWRYDDEDHVSTVSTGFLICPPDRTTPCGPPA